MRSRPLLLCGNGADLCLRHNPGLTTQCEPLKGKFHPHMLVHCYSSPVCDVHCDADVILKWGVVIDLLPTHCTTNCLAHVDMVHWCDNFPTILCDNLQKHALTYCTQFGGAITAIIRTIQLAVYFKSIKTWFLFAQARLWICNKKHTACTLIVAG